MELIGVIYVGDPNDDNSVGRSDTLCWFDVNVYKQIFSWGIPYMYYLLGGDEGECNDAFSFFTFLIC